MSFSSSSSSGRRPDARLTLGVKGRLSNQEMEQLRHQLAAAAAYDHVPEDKRFERRAKSTSTPMTRVYRKLEPDPTSRQASDKFRPGIKTQATIEYEKKFAEGSYDALRMRPPPRGIGDAAKTRLQDEYVTRPREISVIPRNSYIDQEGGEATNAQAAAAACKRHAASTIPQVFIM